MKGATAIFGIACGAVLVALYATASTQQCNTACQTRMTDCILSCDGRLPCELDCKSKAAQCVDRCSSDAGPPVAEPRSVVDGGEVEARSPLDARAPIDASRGVDARAPTDARAPIDARREMLPRDH